MTPPKTIACAAAVTDGEVMLQHARADLLGAAGPVLVAADVELEEVESGLVARRSPIGLTGTDLQTRSYPGFATDLQSPVRAMLATAKGASAITETIFEQRFRHVEELRKMGATITVHGQTAWMRGVERLTDARRNFVLSFGAWAGGLVQECWAWSPIDTNAAAVGCRIPAA